MIEATSELAVPDEGYIVPFEQLGAADLARVGGKGSNLGELSRAGFPVPHGFCLTTAGYRALLAGVADAARFIDELDRLGVPDTADALENIRRLGAALRRAIESTPLPDAIAEALVHAWSAIGPEHTYAVRSSATAEDLPGASFAGQQETFLNVAGQPALLEAVRGCMASLFTDRAIVYRAKNGFSHGQVALSVIVQRMAMPEVSGVLFTADPIANSRKICTIDATYGLGEVLVSGQVCPDSYRVDKRSGEVLEARVGDKNTAIWPIPGGGTRTESLDETRRSARALTDAQACSLAELGVRIEAHFGQPQDIEWCLEQGEFRILQSRPITSLYPMPEPAPDDDALHVYASVGHFQGMTDPMSPMGLSVFKLLMPWGRHPDIVAESPVAATAGGRLYVDVTSFMSRPRMRRKMITRLDTTEPLMAQGIKRVIDSPAFFAVPSKGVRMSSFVRVAWPILAQTVSGILWRDPEVMRANAIEAFERVHDDIRARIRAAEPGPARLREAKAALCGFMWLGLSAIAKAVPGFSARFMLEKAVRGRVDEANLDALDRALEGNITTEMDLAVGDLADTARASAAVCEALLAGEASLQAVETLDGGPAFADAVRSFLERFGFRGPSEIDIGRLRYRDDPAMLLRIVAGNLRNEEVGGHRAHHGRLVAAAREAAAHVEAAAANGWLGGIRRRWVRRLMRVHRVLFSLRDHPKFTIVRILDVIRSVVEETGATLVSNGRLQTVRDVYWLGMDELIHAAEDESVELTSLIAGRKAEYARYRELTPPRVITSEGEIPEMRHDTADVPDGALPGVAASAGLVEGVARVIHDPVGEILHSGEILVTRFTDPGWTPLFLNAAGLVMEVGALMSHGTVIAREYGIPAVVGVLDATEHIRTGDRIRVHGTGGYIELLPPERDGV